jgi:hypothetical protein
MQQCANGEFRDGCEWQYNRTTLIVAQHRPGFALAYHATQHAYNDLITQWQVFLLQQAHYPPAPDANRFQ